VLVLDQDGERLEGAEVCAHIPFGGSGFVVRDRTDDEGEVTLSIPPRSSINLLRIVKDGFYESKYSMSQLKGPDAQYEMQGDYHKVTLKERLNPIPMYAWRSLKVTIPAFEEAIGFDLFEIDWVAPYGKGKHSDMTFHLSGYWNSFNDKDATLRLSFPNEGDGIVAVEYDQFSDFKSPYLAPSENYLKEKEWRRAQIKNEEYQPGSVEPQILVIDETSRYRCYAFRIRSEIDEHGNIEKAYYGKFYRSINFDGVTREEMYSYIYLTYYLNPTANDRNLEFDPGQNLLQIKNFVERPREP
jgi:hypothetical protein